MHQSSAHSWRWVKRFAQTLWFGLALSPTAVALAAPEGIYIGQFASQTDNGGFAMMVVNGQADVVGYNSVQNEGIYVRNLTVNANGQFSGSTAQGGTFSGTVGVNSVTGTFQSSGGGSGAFTGSRKDSSGALSDNAGFYAGTYSGDVSGSAFAVAAADGLVFFYVIDNPASPSADGDGGGQGTINPTSGALAATVVPSGIAVNGTLNTQTHAMSGTYTGTGFSGSFSLTRSKAQPISSSAVVSNVRAAQVPGTHKVEILYDLANPGGGAVEISVQVSTDGGGSYVVSVPAAAFTGHVGTGVMPGTDRKIVLDASATGSPLASIFTRQLRFRVQTGSSGPGTAPEGFSLIPAGDFIMGRTSGDTDSNAPPVTVTVGAFYLAETETTKALWDAVRTWALAVEREHPYTGLAAGGGKAADHPVQTVSWFDVVKWCNARSEKEGLTPVYTVGGNVMRTGTSVPDVNWSANGYRLPTEAEWEKAARGGVAGARFPWGTDTISHAQANFWNIGSESYQSGTTNFHPTYEMGGFPYTSPVGSFAGNGYGLKDMSGNVREWCWDWQGGSYTEGAADPRGPASGENRILRGGSWFNYAISARCAVRNYDTPSYSHSSFGFRSARSSVP